MSYRYWNGSKIKPSTQMLFTIWRSFVPGSVLHDDEDPTTIAGTYPKRCEIEHQAVVDAWVGLSKATASFTTTRIGTTAIASPPRRPQCEYRIIAMYRPAVGSTTWKLTCLETGTDRYLGATRTAVEHRVYNIIIITHYQPPQSTSTVQIRHSENRYATVHTLWYLPDRTSYIASSPPYFGPSNRTGSTRHSPHIFGNPGATCQNHRNHGTFGIRLAAAAS